MTRIAAPDRYVREHVTALMALQDNGFSEFHGVHSKTIRALARRGLVYELGDGRAGVTPAGDEVIRRLWQSNDEGQTDV